MFFVCSIFKQPYAFMVQEPVLQIILNSCWNTMKAAISKNIVHSEAQGKATCHVVDRERWKSACNQPAVARLKDRRSEQDDDHSESSNSMSNALMAEARLCLRVSPAGSTVPLTAEPRRHRKQEGWLELMLMLMRKQDHSCSSGPNKSS